MIIRVVSFLCLAVFAIAQTETSYSLTTYTESALSDTSVSKHFESWNDLFVNRGNFRVGARVALHRPAAEFGQQADTWGLEQRFLEYRGSNTTVRVGNFYSLLGRGLTMRSFENRTLRWDANLDGARFDYRHKYFDTQLIAGVPRKTRLTTNEIDRENPPTAGETLPAQYGGELRLKPGNFFQFGGTYVQANGTVSNDDAFSRGSVYAQSDLDWGSFYGEFATIPYPDSYQLPDGEALYLSSNVFLGDLSILGEYKSYKDFALYDGLLNNPPTAIREHLYTLLNRHQLIQDANDERGFMIEANYPVLDDGIATVSFSRTEDSLSNQVYRDVYAEFSKDEFAGGEWVWAVGQQVEFSRTYLNFVSSADYSITDYYSIKIVVEHLHATDEATLPNRQYYDQLLTIGLSKAPNWTLSFIGEHSTDHTVDKNYVPGQAETQHFYWGGGQLDLNVLDKIDLSLFAGSRRKGKVCIGGVCVVKPELKGAEVTIVGRF